MAKIINPDNLPESYILAEVKQFEQTHPGYIVNVAEFHDMGNGFSRQSFKCSSIPFEKIRRITGYLVGDVSRWNNAKIAELEERVSHM